MKRIAKNKGGFTLLEIIMVVAIIVILTGVMALNITTYIQRAKNYSSEEVQNRSSAIGLVSQYENRLSNLGFGREVESASEGGASDEA